MGRSSASKSTNARTPRDRQERRRRARLILLLIAVPSFVFAQTIGFEFLDWDDKLNLIRFADGRPLNLAKIWSFWREPYFNLYAPLSYTFFAAEAWVSLFFPTEYGNGGLNPGIFHAASVAIHIANTLLVFRLLRRFVKVELAACAGALWFAIHPLQVEPVSWVSGTRDLLAGFFSLASLWWYLEFAEPVGEPSGAGLQRRWLRYGLAIGCFVLALLCKPSAAGLPLLILVVDIALLRRPLRAVAVSVTPLLLITAVAALLTKQLQPDQIMRHVTGIWDRPRIAGDALTFYLGKLIAPYPLAPDYGRPARAVLQDSSTWWKAVVPLVVCGLLLLSKDRRIWLAALGIFVAAVAPVLGFVPFGYQDISTVADRYVYLSMLGPALAVAWFVVRYPGPWTLGILTAALLVLTGLSCWQTSHWRDQETLFRYCLKVSPRSFVALNTIGAMELRQKHYEQAEQLFQTAKVLDSNYGLTFINLGNLNKERGRPDAAIADFQQAIQLWPWDPAPYNNLGNVYLERDQFQLAMASFHEALRLNPDHPPAHLSMAVALMRQQLWPEAWPHIQSVLVQMPADATAQRYAGMIQLNLGKVPAAKIYLNESLRLDPNQPELRRLLLKLSAPGAG